MAIISKSKQWCFIHINRTGGTTVRQILSKQIQDFNFIVGSENGTIKECVALNSEILDYYKFSFVRQPYDLLLSIFYF